jgi:GntR family histidine utilization transcriptional repressor
MNTKASAALQPLYLKVKRHILDNIGSGKWAVSARVPSENEIVKKFGVSRMTANRALKELSDEGVLVRIAGRRQLRRRPPCPCASARDSQHRR